MSSADALRRVFAPYAVRLVALARESIRHGLDRAGPLPVAAAQFPEALRLRAASFVTLHLGDDLRGCVGSIEPRVPLVEDVARNAWLAAFHDTRFRPLEADEFAGLSVEISVLGPDAPLPFRSEAELIASLAPGEDGLIIEADGQRGVFLPQVWDDLPEPARFLAHLKAKAGMAPRPLGPDATARRFTVVKLALADAA